MLRVACYGSEILGIAELFFRPTPRHKELIGVVEIPDDSQLVERSRMTSGVRILLQIKKRSSITPKVEKRVFEDDEDEKPLKIKKRPSITPKVKKQVFEDDEDEKPLKVPFGG